MFQINLLMNVTITDILQMSLNNNGMFMKDCVFFAMTDFFLKKALSVIFNLTQSEICIHDLGVLFCFYLEE